MIVHHIQFIEQFHLSSKLTSSCNSVEGGGVEFLIVVLGDDEGALRPGYNHYVMVLNAHALLMRVFQKMKSTTHHALAWGSV